MPLDASALLPDHDLFRRDLFRVLSPDAAVLPGDYLYDGSPATPPLTRRSLIRVSVSGSTITQQASVANADGTENPIPQVRTSANGGATWGAWAASPGANLVPTKAETDPVAAIADALLAEVLAARSGSATLVSRLSMLAALAAAAAGGATRPGDSTDAFAIVAAPSALAGDRTALPPIPATDLFTNDQGNAAALDGSGILASRHAVALEPGRLLRLRAAVQRLADPGDPSGDAVRTGVVLLDQAGVILPGAAGFLVLDEAPDLRIADGVRVVEKLFVRGTVSGATSVPAAARYAIPAVRTYGADGRTAVQVLAVEDVTGAVVADAVSSAVATGLAALQSLDLGPRIGALESAAGSPKSLTFNARSDAQAATVPASVQRLAVFGVGPYADDLLSHYVRSGTSSGQFQTADGARWRLDGALQGVVAADLAVNVGPGQTFPTPPDFTAWIARRRISPGVFVTVTIASGVYNCTKPLLGHPDGAQIKWQNAGLNGAPFTGADFPEADAIAISTTTGIPASELTNLRNALRPKVRAKYKVILEFDDSATDFNAAFQIRGGHSGDWTLCPTLFIATGPVAMAEGVTTGAQGGASHPSGSAGTGVFPGSCFFGFRSNLVIDDGGNIFIERGLALCATDDNMRTDFTGGFNGNYPIIIGAPGYGYRANHGGFAWCDYVYIRANGVGVQIDNSPGMTRMHWCDIQRNFRGVQVQHGGSAKVADGKVKNNAYSQIIARVGAVDANRVDAASTALFGGNPPPFGISSDVDGGILAQDAVCTGHVRDFHVNGAGGIFILGATWGNLWTGTSANGFRDAAGMLRQPAQGRPGYGTVEVADTTLVLPNPVPKTIGVVRPAGHPSAGTPITVTSITNNVNLPVGEDVTFCAPNAAASEPVTINKTSVAVLQAATRSLPGANDMLTLFRARTGGLLERTHQVFT